MRRREFIAGLGGAAVWPLRAQAAMPVIGYLSGAGHSPGLEQSLRWFLQGLGQVGFVEGQNVAIEYRFADGLLEKLPSLAADLVRHQVEVIVAAGGLAEALEAKKATSQIPVVFQTGVDPVSAGLVASLARPGGNVTGVTQLAVELLPKQLELLREMVPAAAIVAFLVNPTSYPEVIPPRELQTAARTFGLKVLVLNVRAESDFASAFEEMSQQRAGFLMIAPDRLINGHLEQLAALALRHALPAVYAFRGFAAAGGLMSYGGSIADALRLVGVYTGRILKGDRPEDLPVQQSTKVELVINLKTAKALGLTIPPNLLVRADEVIE
jgi:putative tryptophan/tyrosine transport system substrate-binding protein